MLCSYIHEKSGFPVYHTLFDEAGQAVHFPGALLLANGSLTAFLDEE